MTTVSQKTKKCGYCGTKLFVPIVDSTCVFGYIDLDTRPAPMERYNLEYEIQYCRSCGYCRNDITQKTGKEIAEILKQKLNLGILHNRFYRAYQIEKAENKMLYSRVINLLRAAWACDDENKVRKAEFYRKLAVEEIGDSYKENFMGTEFFRVLKIDLYRRSGYFKQARDIINSTYKERLCEQDRKIIEFERYLAEQKDTGCYTVGDAINHGKDFPPLDKKSHIPEISPNDISLEYSDVVGSFAIKDFEEIIKKLKSGDIVLLEREPDNRYDENAIRVDNWQGQKLGYIPRQKNPPLAKLIDDGRLLYAKVESKSDHKPYLIIEIFQSAKFKLPEKLDEIKIIRKFHFHYSNREQEYDIYFTNKGKNKIIRFISGNYCSLMGLDLAKRNPFSAEMPSDIIFKEVLMSNKRFEKFVAELSACHMNSWDSEYRYYMPADQLDMKSTPSWNIRILYNEHSKLISEGCCKFPPYWKRFLNVLAEYVDYSFEIDSFYAD